ncbi:hypothetical protein BGZ60DRAFT_534211 [Tricladium varicosporioides]|nr:hypothetical protein BGZ60DRAFT_534211 [Hymenoscyphus varicosporioides]
MAPFPSFTKTWHDAPYPGISPNRPELSLVGKTAVVTGGGTGIGLAISKALAEAGVSKLAIIGRRPDILAKARADIKSLFGTHVFTVSANIANKVQVDAAFSQIKADFGKPINILVSNAGFFGGQNNVGAESDTDLSKSLDANVKGVYFVTSAFVANAATDAAIINVSTAIAHLPPFPGFASYAATKLAGTKILEYVAGENPGMHVVDMHPGQVRETEMARKVPNSSSQADHIDDVELPGHFAVWLLSAEASFLKGKFVWCNWDVEELKAKAEQIKSTSVLTINLDGTSSFQ